MFFFFPYTMFPDYITFKCHCNFTRSSDVHYKGLFCLKSFSSILPHLTTLLGLYKRNSCLKLLSPQHISGKNIWSFVHACTRKHRRTSRLHKSQYAKLGQNPGILISDICNLVHRSLSSPFTVRACTATTKILETEVSLYLFCFRCIVQFLHWLIRKIFFCQAILLHQLIARDSVNKQNSNPQNADLQK